MDIQFNQTLDVKGAKCPMPIVKSRKAIKDLPVGNVLQVIATDRGSVADFQDWAKTAKNFVTGHFFIKPANWLHRGAQREHGGARRQAKMQKIGKPAML